MNRKRYIALSAMAVTAISCIENAGATETSEAKTSWHIGLDVGMATYKQERKQNKFTYEDALKIVDHEYEALHETWISAANVLDAADRYSTQKKNIKKDMNLDQVGKLVKEIRQKVDDLDEWKTGISEAMRRDRKGPKDLLSGEALTTFDKGILPIMRDIQATLRDYVTNPDINWAINNKNIWTWADENFFPYAKDYYPDLTEEELRAVNARNILFIFHDVKDRVYVSHEKFMNEAIAKRQATEKVSNRITSPTAEFNIGVTHQSEHGGVIGAEMLLGVNFKDLHKKKKDIYRQKRTPMYVGCIGRLGFVVNEKVEFYMLAGARLNRFVPIAGAGFRVNMNKKSNFFKAEFQKTLGKKYPKGHTIKFGFGWKMN